MALTVRVTAQCMSTGNGMHCPKSAHRRLSESAAAQENNGWRVALAKAVLVEVLGRADWLEVPAKNASLEVRARKSSAETLAKNALAEVPGRADWLEAPAKNAWAGVPERADWLVALAKNALAVLLARAEFWAEQVKAGWMVEQIACNAVADRDLDTSFWTTGRNGQCNECTLFGCDGRRGPFMRGGMRRESFGGFDAGERQDQW